MGLLTRGPSKKTVDDSQMPIVDHLNALRRALTISAIAWVAVSIVCWFFTVQFLAFIEHRAGLTHSFVYFGPAGAVVLRLKVALYAGTFFASPIIFWQAWWFVAPGLHMHEKRIALPLILATSFFFLLGVAACFYSLPLFLKILDSFGGGGVLQYLPNGDDFISFLLAIGIAFGVVFELPVVLWTLGMLNIISSRWLWQKRLYWLVGLGLVSNIMTPGVDPISPLIIFVPLVIFYLGSMLLLKISGK
ncbi:MAG: twin-arginine translocase subunit TatC [Candidatus Dormiibacterota bacterium]